jgi:hypothetical protein
MRRSYGREQARVTQALVRRYTQDAADLTQEASGTYAQQEVGGIDGSGNWYAAGISNVTSTADPFYSGG